MKKHRVVYEHHEVDGVYMSRITIIHEDGRVDYEGSKYPKYVLEVIYPAIERLVMNNIVVYSGLSSEAAYCYLWYIGKILVLGVLSRISDLSRYSDYVDEHNTRLLGVFFKSSNYGKIESSEDALVYEFKFAHPDTYEDDIKEYTKKVLGFISDSFDITEKERVDVSDFIHETLIRMVQR